MLVAIVLFFNLALSVNAAVIGYFGTDYREIDPLTGGTTFVAGAGGGTIYNTIFALDQRAGIAYRRSGEFDVTSTDLTTGISKTVTLSEAPQALGAFNERLIG